GGAIVDAVGMQLQIDPLVDAHRAHTLGISRAGAERQTVEDLLNLLVGQQLAGLRRRLLRCCGCNSYDGESWNDDRDATHRELGSKCRSLVTLGMTPERSG